MNSTELRDLLEAYSEVYTPQEVDEAMTAVASPAPGGRGKKNPYTKEVRTSAGSKTSPGYSNVKDAKERMKTPLSKYDTPKMELKRGVKEEFDTFNYLLEYLVAEGYADTNKAAIAIMANMSEEWKESIILGESALGAGTMAVLAGMSAGRAIHGKLQDRKAKKELEAKRRTSDYLIMKDKTKNIVARDRSASGDTRNEEYVDESQYARENPEKYEREQAKAKSKKQKAMEDPHTGINSPAFEKFMRQQMGR